MSPAATARSIFAVSAAAKTSAGAPPTNWSTKPEEPPKENTALPEPGAASPAAAISPNAAASEAAAKTVASPSVAPHPTTAPAPRVTEATRNAHLTVRSEERRGGGARGTGRPQEERR